jgi:hypothetical protein
MNEQDWESRMVDLIFKARSRRRKYASFNEWPDKSIKEKSIVLDLLEAMTTQDEDHGITRICAFQPDPPDCTGIDSDGKLVAFEVSELVDQDTILRNEYGHDDWKEWSEEELLEKIREVVKKKDAKKFHGGPYSKIILVIHTDEPLLRLTDCVSALAGQIVGQCRQITDCYLLMSYSPGLKSYPYFRLAVSMLV